MARKKLGEILIEAGVLDEQRLRAALNEQRRWGGPLGRLLVQMHIVPEDALVDALARQLGLPQIKLEGRRYDGKALDLVPVELCQQHSVVPFAVEGKFLDVAMSDPTNLGIVDELRIRTQLNVRPWLAGPSSIERAIDEWYLGKIHALPAAAPGGEAAGAAEVGSTYARRPGSFAAEAAAAIAQGGASAGVPAAGAFDAAVSPAERDREIRTLQARMQTLEGLVQRDEDVLRKLLMILIDKGICTREEILERIR